MKKKGGGGDGFCLITKISLLEIKNFRESPVILPKHITSIPPPKKKQRSSPVRIVYLVQVFVGLPSSLNEFVRTPRSQHNLLKRGKTNNKI